MSNYYLISMVSSATASARNQYLEEIVRALQKAENSHLASEFCIASAGKATGAFRGKCVKEAA